MGKTITVRLSAEGITRAIEKIEGYKASLAERNERMLERLRDIAVEEAQFGVTDPQVYAVGDNTDVEVSSAKTDGGYDIIARGEQVAFLEFGTGVHYNRNGENYPIAKPDGIVGIGEYGNGQGKKDSWRTPSGKRTQGIPAGMFMYNANEKMREEFPQIAKEEFG